MYPFEAEKSVWNGLDDYNSFNDFDASDFYWTSPTPSSSETPTDSLTISAETGVKRGREQKRSPQSQSKSCREKLRREKMNDRLSELWSLLHPEKPAKVDKSVILGDALCAVYKLQSEVEGLRERNRKLQADIQNLKAEKNELREEKQQLRATKENMELKIKATAGFIPVQPEVYQSGGNKLMAISGYGGFPMWQWISPAVANTSQDHVLSPPVA